MIPFHNQNYVSVSNDNHAFVETTSTHVENVEVELRQRWPMPTLQGCLFLAG